MTSAPSADVSFGIGDLVKLKGLKASHMNGLRGCIISYDEDSQRFGVLVSVSSEQKALKSMNLELYAFSADSAEICASCRHPINLSAFPPCWCSEC